MTRQRTCPVVGLVGGVGSGKSTLAKGLSHRCGAVVVDGDEAGHQAILDSEVKSELRKTFGNEIFKIDGTVDRKGLASLVFGESDENCIAKVQLERIVHPHIEGTIRHQISAAQQANAPLILLDAAVLLETGWREFCDKVIFVEADDPTRRARALRRGWSEEDWQRREASQMPLAEKRKNSDALIENSGTIDSAVENLHGAIEDLCGIKLLCNLSKTATIGTCSSNTPT